MYKIKATKREMRENFRILSIGYCDMQCLLRYQSPIAYSSGVYGWACDYYEVDDVIISTGYAPINSKNMKNDYKLVKEYENKAINLSTEQEKNKL
jgi:hypothetical protein